MYPSIFKNFDGLVAFQIFLAKNILTLSDLFLAVFKNGWIKYYCIKMNVHFVYNVGTDHDKPFPVFILEIIPCLFMS